VEGVVNLDGVVLEIGLLGNRKYFQTGLEIAKFIAQGEVNANKGGMIARLENSGKQAITGRSTSFLRIEKYAQGYVFNIIPGTANRVRVERRDLDVTTKKFQSTSTSLPLPENSTRPQGIDFN